VVAAHRASGASSTDTNSLPGAPTEHLRHKAAGESAARLRLSLRDTPPTQIVAADRGVALGLALPARHLVYASWEDGILVVFTSRTGKTTAVAVPAILAAPGAVVVTSNKADTLQLTAELRARDTKQRVWVFDPQHIAHTEQTWWFNPLGGTLSIDDVTRLAAAFVLTVDDGSKVDIWGPAARELISNLMMAAHQAGKTLLDVYAWLMDEAAQEPVLVLRAHDFPAAADSLDGTQRLNERTRSSVYWTARSAMSCLRDPAIAAWVTPRAGLAEFDPAKFATSRQTLYLMSKDARGGTSAGPLVAALTDRVRGCAERAAERAGGRLDPPMLLVLDEAANVCRIADLPELYSHLGSRGIIPITILQNYPQGERVWGKAGMRELWNAATVKLVGPGLDDAEFNETMSRLIGEHDVDVVTYSWGRDGSSRSTTTRRERILPPDAMRTLQKGQAILLATATPAALLELVPWYRGPRREEVAQAEARAKDELTERVRRPGPGQDTDDEEPAA